MEKNELNFRCSLFGVVPSVNIIVWCLLVGILDIHRQSEVMFFNIIIIKFQIFNFLFLSPYFHHNRDFFIMFFRDDLNRTPLVTLILTRCLTVFGLQPRLQAISYGKLVPVRWFSAYICKCMIERETSWNRANRNFSAFFVTLRINDNSRCSFDCNRDNSGDSVILQNQSNAAESEYYGNLSYFSYLGNPSLFI
jgi:hypothetical protein